MIKHVLLPERVGGYYLFQKKILSFDINPAYLQASLLVYKGRSISVEKNETLFLSDFSAQTVEAGIKKLAASMGQHDEVVTSISSSQVVFKELELPFLGRDKIAMVIGFEVEPFLPFSYQEALVDFIVLDEDVQNAKSKILVAAVRKHDVTNLVQHFEKAKIKAHQITVDLFSFYNIYQAALYNSHKKTSELYINIDFETVTVVYMNKGILKASRVIPLGLLSVVHKISDALGIEQQEIFQHLFNGSTPDSYHKIIASEIASLVGQIKMSMKFFEKSCDLYEEPHQVYIWGAGSCLYNIEDTMQNLLSKIVSRLDIAAILGTLSVKVDPQLTVELCRSSALVTALSVGLYNESNFLSESQDVERAILFLLQIVVLSFVTFGGLGLVYWNVSSNIGTLQSSYNRSRRELADTVERSMVIKVNNSKPSDIVKSAQEALKKESIVASSAQQAADSVFLEYLQKLSIAMDRQSLGLELTRVKLDYDSIVLNGSVKGFDELTDLQKKLALIKIFTIVEKPSTATNFTIKLHINRQDEL